MTINLTFTGRYNAGGFGDSRAEIVATDGVNAGRAYVVNGGQNRIDILDISNPATPALSSSVALTAPAGEFWAINSVAGFGGLLAVAVGVSTAALRNAESGKVVLFTPDGTILSTLDVGVGPDMVTFTPDGRKILTANEGEPVTSALNPEGSVSIISLPAFTAGNAASISAAVAAATVSTVGFGGITTAQQTAAIGQGLKIQPGVTFAADLEPEYITVSADSSTAYVTLQENNGLAIVNLTTGAVTGVQGLRAINLNVSPQFQLDASDRDSATNGGINIKNHPISALFQPDSISSFQVNGRTFLVTANEGDTRDWGGTNFPTPIAETLRIGNSGYVLNPANFPDAATLKLDANLGRLQASTYAGNTDGNAANGFEQIVIGGSRSFTIWDQNGNMVWDSGDFLETLTSQFRASSFNANSNANAADNRSDDKGPEPEAVEVGVVNGVPFAFVGLERFGGIAVFDLSNPSAPAFVQYINTRDFTATPAAGAGGDLGPEGIKFIAADKSPNGKPMLAVAYEVSNTTAFYEIAAPARAANAPSGVDYRLQILHGSDFEAGLKAISTDGGGTTARAANFAAIVDKLEDESPNSITLSGGDNFLPGPVYASGGDPGLNQTYNWVYNKLFNRPLDALGNAVDINGDGIVDGYNSLAAGPGRADITLLNIIGVQASALGNHDFDSGPRELAQIARQDYSGAVGPAGDRWVGAQFPYLSVNLSITPDPDMGPAYTTQIREWSTYRTGPAESIAANTSNTQAKFAPSTIITENGEKIAVVGATTQLLKTISSPQAVRVVDAAGNELPSADDVVKLAEQINAETARIKAADATINKFILASHLQLLNNEKTLAPLLNDVDVVLAAGSHTLAAEPTDILRPGDVATETYPIVTTNAAGNKTLIVVTANEFAYVGRLIADFDSAGNIVTTGLNATTSDAFSTDWAGVKRVYGSTDDTTVFNQAFADGSKGYLAEALIEGANRTTGELGIGNVVGSTQGLADIIRAKDGNLFGRSDVYLDGLRVDVRTQETNLGNLSADANLWYAKFYDPSVTVSLKNGGGIRDSIGSASAAGGATTVTLGPTAANPTAGKAEGDISQLDIENSLRFNNALTILSVTAQNLERLLEWGVAGSAPGVTQGRFPQLAGVEVSYDWSQTAIVFNSTTGEVTTDGQRIRSLALTDGAGNVTTKIMENGVFVADPSQQIKMVTLNFLAGNNSQPIFGGDTYPIPLFTVPGSRVDLSTQSGFPAPPAGLDPGALPAAATFATQGTEQDAFAEYMRANFTTTAFNKPETPLIDDLRQFNLTATANADRLGGSSLADVIRSLDGDDRVFGRGGNDTLDGGLGNDTLDGGVGVDIISYAASSAGLTVTLSADGSGTLSVEGFGTDTFMSMEGFEGSSTASDTFTGNGMANNFSGLGGADMLKGLAGADRLSGGGDNDIILGDSEVLMTTSAAAVRAMYVGALDRAADVAGLQGWTNLLNNGGTLLDVATGIVGSSEFQTKFAGLSDGAFVTAMYRSVLDRAPDAGALAAYVSTPTYTAPSRAQMLVDLTTSAEFKATSGMELAAGQAYRLFAAGFSRTPDAGGFDAWTDLLEQGKGLSTAASSFSNSTEFGNIYGSTSNTTFVTDLYQKVLGRAADADGFAFWTGQLGSGALDRGQVLVGFSESVEFTNATNAALDTFMRSSNAFGQDTLIGGPGNDQLDGGRGSDRFVFNATDGGNDTIFGFDRFDTLDLSGFGFADPAAALVAASQQGSNVVLAYSGGSITFADTQLTTLQSLSAQGWVFG